MAGIGHGGCETPHVLVQWSPNAAEGCGAMGTFAKYSIPLSLGINLFELFENSILHTFFISWTVEISIQ